MYLFGYAQAKQNVEGLVEAFSRLANVDYRLKLVIAGKKGWLYEPILKR